MIPGADGWTLESWYAEYGSEVVWAHGTGNPRVLRDAAVGLLLICLAFLYFRLAPGARWRRIVVAQAVVMLVAGLGLYVSAAGLGGTYRNAGMTFAHGNLSPTADGTISYLPGFSGTMRLAWLPCRDCDRLHPISTQEAEGWIMYYRHRDHADPGYPWCCYRLRKEGP